MSVALTQSVAVYDAIRAAGSLQAVGTASASGPIIATQSQGVYDALVSAGQLPSPSPSPPQLSQPTVPPPSPPPPDAAGVQPVLPPPSPTDIGMSSQPPAPCPQWDMPDCLGCGLLSSSCRNGYSVCQQSGQTELATAIEHLATVLTSLETAVTDHLMSAGECISNCHSLIDGSIRVDCSVAADVISRIQERATADAMATLGDAFRLLAEAGVAPGQTPPPVIEFAPTIEVHPNVYIPESQPPPQSVAPGTSTSEVGASQTPPSTAGGAGATAAGAAVGVSVWVSAWAETAAAVAGGSCSLSPAATTIVAQLAATLAASGGPSSIPAVAASLGYSAYLSQSQYAQCNVSLEAWAQALAAVLLSVGRRLLIQSGVIYMPPYGVRVDSSGDTSSAGPAKEVAEKRISALVGPGDDEEHRVDYLGGEESDF